MKISVCIATYNGEKFIRDQLDSILCQIGQDDEIILSDDSSSDKTIEICELYNDSRIKIFTGNTFHSPIFNLENALKKATGDYIFLADQDDVWHPDKVKTCLNNLRDCDLVIHDCEIIDNKGKMLKDSYFRIRNSKNGFLYNLYKSSYLGCCMAFRAELLNCMLPFPKSTVSHDMWIGLIAEMKGRVCFMPDKLIQYRRHDDNASMASEKSKLSICYRLKYRLIIIANITLRLLKRV